LEEITSKINLRSASTLIELTASDSCSGKTALLYFIVAIAVLPTEFNGWSLGGKNGVAVVLDTDNSFDTLILQDTMQQLVTKAIEQQITELETEDHDMEIESPSEESINTNLTCANIENIITASLSQVHIFRPETFQSLLATLDNLPQYLRSLTINKAVQSIILDSASAFYWSLRADQEARKIQALDPQISSTTHAQATPSYLALVQKLRSLSETFECPVIATTWDLGPSSQPLTSRLNPTLPVTPNIRLEVYRSPVRRFPEDISVEAAQGQRSMRDDAIGRHEFSVTNGKEVVTFNLKSGTVEMDS
jgi:hypothetical protein